MKEKVLITGFNGEIGSKILQELVKRGKSVIALDITDAKEEIALVKYIKAVSYTHLTLPTTR